jgi:glycosyltransferase involved in cell wall biosynthesis
MQSNSKPLVTVIIPAYNYGRFISETLDSLLAQSYQNWECIIVDDGSTDNTSEIIAQYIGRDRRFRGIRQENHGPSAARNAGLRSARGKYIQFLDADDLLERRKIEHHVSYLDDNPHVDIVYGSFKYFIAAEPNEQTPSWVDPDAAWMPEKVSGYGKELIHALILETIMVVSGPLLRKETIEEIGYFDTTLTRAEDWHYWIRCAVRGKRFQFLDLPETLTLYRSHPKGLTKDKVMMYEQFVRMRRKVSEILEDKELLRLNSEHLVVSLAYLGVQEMKKGNRMKGIYNLFRAGRYSAGITTKMRWCFSATVAPLAPLDRLDHLLYVPMREMAHEILRHQFKIR